MHPSDIRRLEYILCLRSSIVQKFKERLLTDGHLMKEPAETVYSGVVSLRNLTLAMFLTELNNLQLWGADVGNAYLQALTKESSTLWLSQNLKSYKAMFLLCITENDAQHTFKAPCCCFENAPNTDCSLNNQCEY